MSGNAFNPEIILDIVLIFLLGTMLILAYVFCAVWRVKRYRKGLHHSTAGFAFLVLSSFFGIFLPIGGFTFFDGGTAGTKLLIIAVVFCPFLIALALRCTCFCIFLDTNFVVQRVLFSEVRIDLSDSETFIDDSKPFTISFSIGIYSKGNQCICFNSRRIEGDLRLFLDECKKVKKEKTTSL